MNRLNEFQTSYQKAVEQIQKFAADPMMGKFTNWILTTSTNLYSCLPTGYAINNIHDCESLLLVVHHALVDDGEISFPVINGEPRIAFISRWEDNYEQYILSDAERAMLARLGKTATIEFLDTIEEFAQARGEWDAANLKTNFIMDTAFNDLDFARRVHPTVTDQQVEEWQEEIVKTREKYILRRM